MHAYIDRAIYAYAHIHIYRNTNVCIQIRQLAIVAQSRALFGRPINPKPDFPKPKPQTLNPKPQTLNPKSLNSPKPQSLNTKSVSPRH